MKIAFFLVLSIFWNQSSLALSPPIGCGIEKLAGRSGQAVGDWEVGILKENVREKSGDVLVSVDKAAGKRCEAELPSWGETLYSARGQKLLVIVGQGDTSYTTLTWVDPQDCKIVKTISEFGQAKFVGASLIFPGGMDGPDVVPAKSFTLGFDCLPVAEKAKGEGSPRKSLNSNGFVGNSKNSISLSKMILEEDFNGDSRKDYVVQESRAGNLYRTSIYLGVEPLKGRPAWSSGWSSDRDENDERIKNRGSPYSDLTILEIAGGWGDVGWHRVLVVDKAIAKEEIFHKVDYDNGRFSSSVSSEEITVEASFESSLKYHGKPLRKLKTSCSSNEKSPDFFEGARFAFHPGKRTLLLEKPICVRSQAYVLPEQER